MLKPRRTIDEPDMKWGIVMWQLPNGKYIENSDGEYLTAGPCLIGNRVAERNIRAAARSLGVKEGQPFWLPGFRKVTHDEWADQMERLLDGKIPDLVDLARAADRGESL